MKFTYLAVLSFGSVALAQALEPSPTESVGCEPHGDHWHCEGPRSTEVAAEEETLAPSPTESVGCEPHGDHWHCEGPRSTEVPEPTTTDAAHDDDHAQTEDPGPIPTDSVGCEPHGDHWHCDGPLSTESPETSETTNAPVEPLPTTSTNEHEHEQTEDAGPSPTESVGCEPHGDHWHCEGPATTDFSTIISSTSAGNGTASTGLPEVGAAGGLSASLGVVAAAGAVAIMII